MNDTASGRHPFEVLAAEFVERYRRGERPSLTEYAVRYPDFEGEIRSLLPAAVLMEGLKRNRLPDADDGPTARGVPERLGDCRVVREVGRGGMGVVYEAEQEPLGRRVAVKVLTAQGLRDPNQLRRFRREARAMARLHHTNIVPVFGFGEHDGLPYYVMQFIDGRGLDRYPAEDPAGREPRRVAGIGLQAAEALAYAHAHGVLHRDVKPSNLLLDAQGTVWVTDFGLARLAGQDSLTDPGELAGTLRYLAPERFRGESDARGDVYALGLTLYELLTGRPAFDATDRGRLVHQVTHEEPPAPRRCDPAIPRDLETVVLRALARDPADRYPSAGELAEDLRRFLQGKVPRARRVGPAERFRRWCRRNPAVACLGAVATTLLVLVAVLASVGYVQTRSALRREEALRQEADRERLRAEASLRQERAAVARETEQREEAVGQRRRAEANLGLALRAFDALFAEAGGRRPLPTAGPGGDDEGELACPPTVSPEVAALLHTLLQFYDGFGERNQADPRLQRAIVKAYRRMGSIHLRLGQLDQAETAFRRALAACDSASFAREINRTRTTAAVCNDVGLVLQMTGRHAEAEKAHRRALRDWRALAAGSASCRSELARTHALLGSALWKTGRAGEAEVNYRRTLDLVADLLHDDADNPGYRLLQARTYRDLSTARSLQGKHRDASADVRKAIGLLTKLAEDFPAVPDYRSELAEVLLALPPGARGAPHDPRPERQLRRAVELTQELAVGFPAVPQYQALRARACHHLGALLQASGRRPEAEQLEREAVTQYRALVSRSPSVPFYQMWRAEACQGLGAVLVRDGRPAEACAALEEAVDALRAFVKGTPSSRFGRVVLAHASQTLADTRRRLGDAAPPAEAAPQAEKAKKRP
jgi:tetratricopeptide (TPR) repeat protein/predicted Ser/Thr protein kinase